MKRRQIWKVVFGFSVMFIIIQIWLWLAVKNTHTIDKETLHRFLHLSHQLELPVFLIDVSILEKLLSTQADAGVKCYILCRQSSNYITFGLEGEVVKQISGVYNITPSYLTECVYSKVPFSDRKEDKEPVHCWSRSQGITIHVVIFYKLSENNWWHGTVQHSNEMYSATEGIFNSITTKEVEVDGFRLRIPEDPHSFLTEKQHSKFVPCNQTRARQFFDRFGKESTVEAESFHSKALVLLQKAKYILDELKVPFWLSSGTCLGWFRQCDIIPYSKDVDIGIFIKDYVVSLVPSMENAGLQLKHRFGKIEDSFELSFQAADLKLDIFFFYEDETSIWNGGTQASTGNKYKYTFPKFSLCWTLLFSLLVRVPCETESYIEANYGRDWFIPVKEWDWKDSPPNVQPNGIWPQEEREAVINVYM